MPGMNAEPKTTRHDISVFFTDSPIGLVESLEDMLPGDIIRGLVNVPLHARIQSIEVVATWEEE